MAVEKEKSQVKLETLTMVFALLQLNRLTPLRSGSQDHDRSFIFKLVIMII